MDFASEASQMNVQPFASMYRLISSLKRTCLGSVTFPLEALAREELFFSLLFSSLLSSPISGIPSGTSRVGLSLASVALALVKLFEALPPFEPPVDIATRALSIAVR